jgi:hypothetical protein
MPPSGRKKPKLGNGAGAIGDKQLPWRNFRNQDLLNTDFVELDPINKSDIEGDKHPTQIDFEYTATKPVVVGPLTKFFIEGRFDVKDTDAGNWRQAKAEDVAEVVLQYNWFEMLIKSVDVFHNNQRISSSNEQRFIAPYLNTMLYRYMHADTKRYLCPQMAHPSHCVPAIRGKWAKDSDAWKEYAVHVFNNDVFHFDFYPLFQFPFYIGSNFMGDSVLRLVPLDRLGKLHVRFTFFDTQKHIFRKTDAAKSYRFVFKKFKMCLEEARLSPAFERQLHSKTKIEFPGVTRLQLVDPVPDSSSTHKTVFQDIFLPEAIFIFCLDKQIASGTYNFSDNQEQNVFKDHRIRHLDFSFDNKKFHLKEPHFGRFRNDRLAVKLLADYHRQPPFGIRPDVEKLNLAAIREGGEGSSFPHIYVSLCSNFTDRERLVPAMDDGPCISRKSDLEIAIQFERQNSQPSSVYVFYAIYSDVANILDTRSQYFSSPYLRYI